jgi:aspartate racemase
LSWVSSLDYYRLFNELTNQRLGGDQAAEIIMFSVNYGEIAGLTKQGKWEQITSIIIQAALQIERAGADCILLGANTMHHIAEKVEESIHVPLLHIADAVAFAINKKGLKKVALLGTRYTMLFDFYRHKLRNYHIETIIPDDRGVDFVNNAIYNELGKGTFLQSTKLKFLELINDLSANGAEGIILGCTEIPMLIRQEDTAIPVFDTTFLHAQAAVNFILQ